MKTLKSSRYFWELFASEQRRESHDPLEHKRYLCLLGFTSVEGALAAWWESVVLPEWEETLSLVDAVLGREEDLTALVARSGGALQKSQLVATLRFISNTGDPERYSPSLCDVGCMILLLTHRSASEPHAAFARELLRSQRLRNLVVHVGRGMNELEAHEAVKSLKRLSEQGPHAHPLFAEAFGVQASGTEELAA